MESTDTPVVTGNETAGAPAGLTDRYGIPVDANKGDQFASFDVDAFEVPSHKDEIWRFTPLRRLRGLQDGSVEEATGELRVEVEERDGVTVERVSMDDARLGEAGAPRDRVAAQAFRSTREAVVVTVGAERTLDGRVLVTVDGPGVDRVAYGHLQIRLERFADATFVLDQRGSGIVAENVEFVVGDSAHLEVVCLQDWEDDAVHVAGHHLVTGRDARITYTSVSFGGDLVRISPVARFAAPGGEVTLNGLYFADDGQHIEHRLLVDHAVPNCRSEIMYKGALQGDPD